MHFDRLDLAAHVAGLEGHVVTNIHHAGFDAADRHGANTRDRIYVLDRQPQRRVCRRLGLRQIVQRLKDCWAVEPVCVL